MAQEFSNADDVIDSRDVIARIEELEGDLHGYYDELTEDAGLTQPFDEWAAAVATGEAGLTGAPVEWAEELATLKALAAEGESSPDWAHGETLIREDYFVSYTEQLIDDCYEMPKEMKSGDWPWRHVSVNFEAAAEELKADYFEVDYAGVAYLIRA